MAMMVTTLMNRPTTTTCNLIPEQWAKFRELAAAEGLNGSAKLRQYISQTIRKAEKEAAAEEQSRKQSAKK